jgi:hypothetical protein
VFDNPFTNPGSGTGPFTPFLKPSAKPKRFVIVNASHAGARTEIPVPVGTRWDTRVVRCRRARLVKSRYVEAVAPAEPEPPLPPNADPRGAPPTRRSRLEAMCPRTPESAAQRGQALSTFWRDVTSRTRAAGILCYAALPAVAPIGVASGIRGMPRAREGLWRVGPPLWIRPRQRPAGFGRRARWSRSERRAAFISNRFSHVPRT